MRHLLFILLLFSSFNLLGQKTLIKGLVRDSSGQTLPAVSVLLLQVQDSVMSAYATSDAEGRYVVKARAAGNFLLQFNYVGYQTHWMPVHIEPGQTEMLLEPVQMAISNEVLPYVSITAERNPMNMRGDTVEYNTAAFKVQPGDAVEDLLKKMPGIEVQRDGTVKAHGETVQNVLVDGKEFFGKDTRIATQNLPADAVDKVQVFDKKSDMAEFTGIDDGQEERTINLKLKEGHKHGYFGKVDAGAGTEGRYEGRFNLNRFSANDRLSAVGLMNNTNQQGFSINDYMNFMGGMGAFMSGGGMRLEISDDGGLPIDNGRENPGIRSSHAIGLNWSKDFSNKTDLTASYFLNSFKNDLRNNVLRENFSDEGSFSNTEDEESLSRNLNHRINFRFKHKIDSFQNIILRGSGGFSSAMLHSKGNSAAYNTLQLLQNEGLRDYRTNGANYNLESTLVYRKRFRRQGRAVVGNGTLGLADRSREGTLYGINTFYDLMTLSDTLQQRQLYADAALNWGLNVVYTEPLGHKRYLAFNAARQNYTNQTNKDFYDILAGGEQINTGLSNHFRRGYVYDRGGMDFMVDRKKLHANVGADFQHSHLESKNLDENMPLLAQYSTILPGANFSYDFTRGQHLNLDYSTRLQEPMPEQLQPVIDNSDPLNVYIGNPALEPEYTHDLRLSYFLYDQFSFTSVFARIGGMYTHNRITEATSLDSLLRRTVTPLNVDFERNLRGSVEFGTPIRPLKIKVQLKLNANYTQRLLYLNTVENQVNDWRSGLDFSIENRNKDKVDVQVGYRLSGNRTQWASNESLNRHYANYQWYAELSYTPFERWNFDTRFDYTVYDAAVFGERTVIPLWKAEVSCYVLKNKRGRVRLSANDLLNQNKGLTRSSQLNFVEEQRYNVLGQYFLLSFGYSLSGFEDKKGAIELNFSN